VVLSSSGPESLLGLGEHQDNDTVLGVTWPRLPCHVKSPQAGLHQPDISRSQSYHVCSLSPTPARSTPETPETHLHDHRWMPTTLEMDGTIMHNPLNTLYILTHSPTPRLSHAPLLQVVVLLDSHGNMRTFGMTFLPPNTRLLHRQGGIFPTPFLPSR
jgi:hypothetical protein